MSDSDKPVPPAKPPAPAAAKSAARADARLPPFDERRLRYDELAPHCSQLRADELIATFAGGIDQKATPEQLAHIATLIPDEWLGDESRFATIEEHRNGYRDVLLRRLDSPREWVEDAARAQASRV